jgi:hypothetical protein
VVVEFKLHQVQELVVVVVQETVLLTMEVPVETQPPTQVLVAAEVVDQMYLVATVGQE